MWTGAFWECLGHSLSRECRSGDMAVLSDPNQHGWTADYFCWTSLEPSADTFWRDWLEHYHRSLLKIVQWPLKVHQRQIRSAWLGGNSRRRRFLLVSNPKHFLLFDTSLWNHPRLMLMSSSSSWNIKNRFKWKIGKCFRHFCSFWTFKYFHRNLAYW